MNVGDKYEVTKTFHYVELPEDISKKVNVEYLTRGSSHGLITEEDIKSIGEDIAHILEDEDTLTFYKGDTLEIVKIVNKKHKKVDKISNKDIWNKIDYLVFRVNGDEDGDDEIPLVRLRLDCLELI